jgi:hypothetical protein
MTKRAPRPKRAKSRDVALVLDRSEDNEGYHVLRQRGEDRPLEVGTIRPLKEGHPIEGEVVSLKPRKDAPFLCDVKTELADQKEARRLTSDGPAQVATEDYRRGWEAIWGKAPRQEPN